jgi:hypothetical protein
MGNEQRAGQMSQQAAAGLASSFGSVRAAPHPIHHWLDLTSDLRFQLFGVVFALGTLHHELQLLRSLQRTGPLTEYMERWTHVLPSPGWSSELALAFHIGNSLLALLMIVLAWRRALLALLATTLLPSSLTSGERFSSHQTVMVGALTMVLVLALAELVERATRSGRPDDAPTDWYAWTRTGLLWLCGLTYAFAALSKLNPVWFSLENSPALDFVLPYTYLLGIPGRNAVALLGYPAIYGTVAVEALLPFMLLWRRTRLLGFFLGLLFHLPMLGQGLMDFPLIMMAFYPLFMSGEEARELCDRIKRPSPLPLASTLVLGCLGAFTIWRDRPDRLQRGLGEDPLLILAHEGMLFISFFLFAHVTTTLAAWLLEARATRSWPDHP